jgi:hypothetical protein
MSVEQIQTKSFHTLPSFAQSRSFAMFCRLSILAILLAILLLWIFLFPQTGDGDAVMHFLNAHDSLWQPAKLMGSWARWGAKIPLLIPAQFGVASARCMSAVISIICAWQTIRLAEDLKIPHAPLAAVFLIFQPFVFSLAADTMTELPFALGAIISIRLWMKDRTAASCWVIGYLPTVRPEGFFLCAMWAVMLIARGRPRLIPILGWGTLLWFFGCWILWRDPTYFFAAGWAWPADSLPVYGHGGFFAYVNRWPIYCGPILLLFFLAGVWKFSAIRPRAKKILWAAAAILILQCIVPPWVREHLLPWPALLLAAWMAWEGRREKCAAGIGFFLLLFTLHSILWWRGWFASCGLMRILACTAPVTAIICLKGYNTLMAGAAAVARSAVIAAIALTAMVYYAIEPMNHRIFPLEKACAFVAQHDLLRSAPMIVFGDPMAQAALDMPPNPPNLMHNDCQRAVEMLHLLHMPIGSIGIWDNQHAQQWFHVSISDLNSLGYTVLFTATNEPRVAVEWREPGNSPRLQTYVVIRKVADGKLLLKTNTVLRTAAQ